MTARRFDLYAANAAAFNSRDPEALLAGAAGTGKSLALLAKVLAVCGKYPGARTLIVRKTRESLTETVLVTWERDVLGPAHPVLTAAPTLRRVRQNYRFANGSTVVVGGMDKPDKVLSSEWDLIYCPEALDLTVTDWETLGGRLRSGVVPYQQIVGDCNPGPPTHWLYRRRRENGGPLTLLTSTHRDNPRYFDRPAGRWTAAGEQYLARLRLMTGLRRKRFLDGLWAAAEGLVYDGFDPAVHVHPAGWRPGPAWPRVWAIDWGFTNPLVLQVWAVDPDGRMHLGREFYKTRVRVETLAKAARKWVEDGEEPRPVRILGDHDPEAAATWKEHFGQTCELADKGDKDGGIDQLQARFDVQPDGRPRVYFAADARRHEPDQALLDAGKPTCTVEELAGYVWDTSDPDNPKDVPIKKDDHGMDCGRYAARYVDRHYGTPPPAAPPGRPKGSPLAGLPAGTFRGGIR